MDRASLVLPLPAIVPACKVARDRSVPGGRLCWPQVCLWYSTMTPACADIDHLAEQSLYCQISRWNQGLSAMPFSLLISKVQAELILTFAAIISASILTYILTYIRRQYSRSCKPQKNSHVHQVVACPDMHL